MLVIIENYFAEILAIEAKLSITQSFLSAKADEIVKEQRTDSLIFSSITCYRDLSLIKAKSNLFTPKYDYSLNAENLRTEIDNIISQNCCFAISQTYEVFESFLIEILTEYLLNNQNKLQVVKLVKFDIILLRETIRNMIKENQKVNNKGLLSMIRKISSHFNKHETKNIHKVNISEWFDLVSMIRHTLVHNRQVVSNRLLCYLKKNNANEMFERHFTRKKIDGKICIFLEANTTSDIICWLNTFAYFIFQSLSSEAQLSYEIPQYLPASIKLSRFSW